MLFQIVCFITPTVDVILYHRLHFCANVSDKVLFGLIFLLVIAGALIYLILLPAVRFVVKRY